MQKLSLDYACEKLGVAVERMAVNDGSIHARLWLAYESFSPLHPEQIDAPAWLIEQYRRLREGLTATVAGRRYVSDVIRQMNRGEAEAAAREIFSISLALDSERERRRAGSVS